MSGWRNGGELPLEECGAAVQPCRITIRRPKRAASVGPPDNSPGGVALVVPAQPFSRVKQPAIRPLD